MLASIRGFVDRVSGYPLLINLWDEAGADSKNRPEFFARATKRLLITKTTVPVKEKQDVCGCRVLC